MKSSRAPLVLLALIRHLNDDKGTATMLSHHVTKKGQQDMNHHSRFYSSMGYALLVLAMQGCDERQMSEGSLTLECSPNAGATGKELRISHPTRPTECKFGIVMMCNSCVYEAGGILSHSASEVCGICIGASF